SPADGGLHGFGGARRLRGRAGAAGISPGGHPPRSPHAESRRRGILARHDRLAREPGSPRRADLGQGGPPADREPHRRGRLPEQAVRSAPASFTAGKGPSRTAHAAPLTRRRAPDDHTGFFSIPFSVRRRMGGTSDAGTLSASTALMGSPASAASLEAPSIGEASDMSCAAPSSRARSAAAGPVARGRS